MAAAEPEGGNARTELRGGRPLTIGPKLRTDLEQVLSSRERDRRCLPRFGYGVALVGKSDDVDAGLQASRWPTARDAKRETDSVCGRGEPGLARFAFAGDQTRYASSTPGDFFSPDLRMTYWFTIFLNGRASIG